MKIWIKVIKHYWMGIIGSILCLGMMNHLFQTVCLWKLIIGIPCPACGITRASLLILKGQFAQAFTMHPLIYLLMIELFLYPLIKNSKYYSALFGFNVIIYLIIFFGFYFYRMYYYFPSEAPMDYYEKNTLSILIQYMGG